MAASRHAVHRPVGRSAAGRHVPQGQRLRLRRPRAGLLGRPLRSRQGAGRRRLLRRQARPARTATTCSATRSATTSSARRCATSSTQRHKSILPPHVWGDGKPDGVNKRAAEEMKNTARAAQKLGVGVVNGFTGSSIWHLLYSFPPVPRVDDRRRLRAVRRALESDPRRVRRVRRAVRARSASRPRSRSTSTRPSGRSTRSTTARSSASTSIPAICIWQGVDPVEFIRAFPDRIYHVHIKDAIVTLNGRSGILASHLNFGDPRRGWDFRSPGRGGVNFEEIIRALNQVGYDGPALGRVGRQRHGPRTRRPRGLRVRAEARLRARATWRSTRRLRRVEDK